MGVEDVLVGDYCLLHHASVQMTQCYARLAPDHLHDAVDNLGFSARFQHTEKPKKAVLYQNGLVTAINGRGERI